MKTPGPRWAVLAFPLASVLLCWDALRPGYVLLPTALDGLPPWSDAAARPPARSNPLASDSLLLTLPARAYNHAMLRAGRLPFWNPHIFCGYPHLALIQNHALYPLTLPLDFLDPLASIDYGNCLHLALAGFLMYAFLRRAGLGRGAALVGGLAFELNGMFLVRLAVPSYLYSGTWLPLMLLGARALLEPGHPRARWALPAGVALSILGGHPQITVLAVALTGAYALGHVFTAAPPPGNRGRLVLRLVLLLILGVGLAGCAVVPFAELLAHSARDAVPIDVYRRSAMPALALAQAVLPDVFGHPVDGTYRLDRWTVLLDGRPEPRYWALNYIGQNLFTGVATLALAALASIRARGRTDVALFGLFGVASLAVLLGTPLLDLAWAILPGFRYSRPDRVVFVYMAAVAILAAHAVDRDPAGGTLSRTARRSFGVVALALTALLAWVALGPLARPGARAVLARWAAEAGTSLTRDAHLRGEAVVAVLVATAVWLLTRRGSGRWATGALAALVVVPNLGFGWRFNPAQPEPRLGGTETEKALLARTGPSRMARILTVPDLFLPPNLTQLLGLHDVQGSSAAGLEGYVRLVQSLDPAAVVGGKYFLAFRDPRVATTPLLSLLSVEWVASDNPLPLPPSGVASGAVALFHNPGFLPRFHVVPRAETYDDVAQARVRLLAPAFDARRVALVSAAQAAAVPPAAPAAADAVAVPAVAVRRYDPHWIELDVEAPAGGLLVTSEAAYPGWRSRVDGRPVETLLVNTAFRGVAVPAGRHHVAMEYVPRSFVAGLLLSGAALSVTLLAAARRW